MNNLHFKETAKLRLNQYKPARPKDDPIFFDFGPFFKSFPRP